MEVSNEISSTSIAPNTLYKRPTGPSPFHFHCTICFEPFDHDVRYPVVLPCGHTYLCAICSKKLTKCMECRASLFMKKPVSAVVPATTSVNSARGASPQPPMTALRTQTARRRYTPSPPPTTPTAPAKTELVPLPLPRNLLLLNLMETAAREASAVKALRSAQVKKLGVKGVSNIVDAVVSDSSLLQDASTSFDSSTANAGADETYSLVGELIDDEAPLNFSFEEDEDAYVWSSIAHISSACGTYAVKDPLGILVLPRKPSSKSPALVSTSPTQVVDNTIYDDLTPPNGQKYVEPPIPYELPYGSHVQVVHIENGWVQLARNRGYLQVKPSQLVKVSGPQDKACEIEGMLLQVDNQRKEISRKQEELARIETGLERDLDKVLLVPFPEPKKYTLDNDSPEKDIPTHQFEPSTPEKSHSTLPIVKPPSHLQIPQSPETRVAALPSTPPSIESVRTPSPTLTPAVIARELGLPKLSPPSNSTVESNTVSPPRSTATTPNRRSARHPASPSSTTINYRTGLSGHCGFLSSQSHARHPNPNTRSTPRMMSEHFGISMWSGRNWKKASESKSSIGASNSPNSDTLSTSKADAL